MHSGSATLLLQDCQSCVPRVIPPAVAGVSVFLDMPAFEAAEVPLADYSIRCCACCDDQIWTGVSVFIPELGSLRAQTLCHIAQDWTLCDMPCCISNVTTDESSKWPICTRRI